MSIYIIIKTLHILSATILFGTGIGIAFFMFCSMFTDNLQQKYFAARQTVIADYCFTLPAVILQPVTGLALIHMAGYNWDDLWLTATYALYIIAGLCWLPVVWIQIQLKEIIKASLADNLPLPTRYHKLFKVWFLLGWPAFLGLVAIFFLMVAKPT